MEDLFNVSAYRKKLIDYYIHACDNTKESQEQRRKAIEKYEDSYLEEIIKNTYAFCLYILEKLEENLIEGKTFFSFRLKEDKIFLYNYYTGGGCCDELFSPCEFPRNFWISMLLFKSFFEGCDIQKDEEVEEQYDEELDIGCEYFYPEINIIVSKEKLDALCEQYKNEEVLLKLEHLLKN